MNQHILEIELHHHNFERWFELAGTPGANHFAVRIGDADGAGAFQVDAGDSTAAPTWGAWVQILGSDDTPQLTGATHYDLHRIEISATERSAPYFIQIGFGATGAAALTAGTYTELVFAPSGIVGEQSTISLFSKRIAVDTNAWARCLCPGQNTGTLDFYFGLHEYLA